MKRLPVLIACVVLAGAGTAQAQSGDELLKKHACTSCHAIDKKLVGPPYVEVAAKYKGDAKAPAMLMESVRKGSVDKWGKIMMPPPAVPVPEADLKTMITYILALKK